MFYLVDSSNKVKAAYSDLTGVPVNGFRVVSVPDNVDIDPKDATDNPPVFEYGDLIRQKYQGILANNPEFSSVLFDDLVDDTVWDQPNSAAFGVGNGIYWLRGSAAASASLRTVVLSLPGPADRFKLVWEVYQLTRTDDEEFNTVEYVEVLPEVLAASVSTELVNPFVSVFNDEPITLTPGDSIRIEFEGPLNDTRYYLGGFALLY
jgi:hypothetical protein